MIYFRAIRVRDQETLKIFLLSAAQRNENQSFHHFSRFLRWLIHEWRRRREKISEFNLHIIFFYHFNANDLLTRLQKFSHSCYIRLFFFHVLRDRGGSRVISRAYTQVKRGDRGKRRKSPSVFAEDSRIRLCWRAIFSLIQKFSLLLFIWWNISCVFLSHIYRTPNVVSETFSWECIATERHTIESKFSGFFLNISMLIQ